MKLEELAPAPGWTFTEVDRVPFEIVAGVPGRRVEPLAVVPAGRSSEGGLAFSPDSKTLVRGAQNGSVSVIDLGDPTKPKRKRLPKGDKTALNTIVVTPDGAHWLTIGNDAESTIKLWDAKTSKVVRTFQHGTRAHFLRVAGEDRAVSAGYQTLKVWKVSTGRCVRKIDFEGSVDYLGVSPDGTRAITAHGWGIVRVWNLATGTLERVFDGASFVADPEDSGTGMARGRAVALSSDGTSFVSCGKGVVETQLTGGELGRIRLVDTNPTFAVTYLPDRTVGLRSRASEIEKDFLDQVDNEGARIAYADWLEQDGRLAEATSIRRGGSYRYALALANEAVYIVDLAAHVIAARTVLTDKLKFTDVAVSPDGRLAAVATGGVIWLFDIDDMLRAGVYDAETRPLLQRAVSSSGLVLNGDRPGLLTSIHGGREPRSLDIPFGTIGFSPDERSVFALGTDHTIKVYDTTTGVIRGHFKHPLAPSAPTEHVVLRDGRLLVGSVGLPLTLWGIDPVTADLFDGDAGHVAALAVDEDAQLVAVGTWSNPDEGGPLRLSIWSLATKQRLHAIELAMDPPQYITALAFAGAWIVAGTSAGGLLRFDRQGTLERAWKTTAVLISGFVVLSNSRLVFDSYQPTLFDLDAGVVLGTLHTPEDSRGYFIPGTTRAVISRLEQKTVTLIDLATSTRYALMEISLYNINPSPDGRYLAIVSEDPASRRVVLRVIV